MAEGVSREVEKAERALVEARKSFDAALASIASKAQRIRGHRADLRRVESELEETESSWSDAIDADDDKRIGKLSSRLAELRRRRDDLAGLIARREVEIDSELGALHDGPYRESRLCEHRRNEVRAVDAQTRLDAAPGPGLASEVGRWRYAASFSVWFDSDTRDRMRRKEWIAEQRRSLLGEYDSQPVGVPAMEVIG